jgi:hypothetical protein
VLEFKYTESLDADALRQTLCYDYFYQQTQHQENQEIQTVLLLAKQPQSETWAKFGYEATAQAGVYGCSHWLLNTIPILSLNELPTEPHNAWVKCFATHQVEKRQAFQLLQQQDWQVLTADLEWFLAGLWQYWFNPMTGDDMSLENLELTPEQVTEMGKFWWPIYQSKLSVEERLAGLSTDDVLSRFKPEERLMGLKPEERLRGLSLAEIEVLETYLQQVKRNYSASQKH